MNSTLIEIINQLKNGDISCITQENVRLINNLTLSLLNKNEYIADELNDMYNILWISNILYNNTDRSMLPLEDGIYDLLQENYKKYNPNYQVGAEPIFFEPTEQFETIQELKPLFREKNIDTSDILFYNELSREPKLNKYDIQKYLFNYVPSEYITKRQTNTKHNYPKLVGTLDKCKFVLNSQAIEKGVFEDSNVQVVERDFFMKHIEMGILHPSRVFKMILELKYDGVSVEGDVSNMIESARTRGDANEGIAADLTPILRGYRFPQAYKIPRNEVFGMKFEAIMTHYNLARYNSIKGKNYSNCRTAISGLISSSDAAKYRDYITLIPLATSLDIDRLTEVEFMNTYYQTGEYLRYTVVEGTYIEILFQIKRFVEEAEYMRAYMPFMYDGVVISYIEQDLINKLGRVNSVNKYSMAIKFNPLKKQTVFRGYTFTIGQDGSVTPMIHYDPVEFFGTIHDKSTGHSYERYKSLQLKEGDLIDVEYVNDVMPYVTKPDNSHNATNPNPIYPFIHECISCGTELIESESGKTIICPNVQCPERNLKRIVAMMQKLNLKDFSEASLKAIGYYSLTELIQLERKDVIFLGDKTSEKFMDRINELKTKEIYDYKIVGSLGFTGIAIEKWKLILNHYTIPELIQFHAYNKLKDSIVHIKGIGPITAQTIADEFNFFLNDLLTISRMSNIIISKGMKSGKTIRFTGFRDQTLMNKLIDMGHDASDKSGVTKTTDILLIPYLNFTSSKTNKVGENTLIIPVQEFIQNMDKYLNFTNDITKM